jgi:hypothetical protein
MTDTRTPDEIEHEIEETRESLKGTIEAIQNTFTPDNLFRALTDNMRSHGGDFGKSVSSAVRENPIALAVTGIGLGWLMFGSGPHASRIEDGARRLGSSGSSSDTRDRAYGEDAEIGVGAARGPVPRGDAPNWDEDRGPSAGQRARAGWRNATGEASRRMRAGADGVRGRSAEMSRRLSEGTGHLSEEARARVVEARRQALETSQSARRSLQRGSSEAQDFFEEHPIVVGALAFAVGAAIAGTLPRSRAEDEWFGAESDALYDEADRIFHEESEKARRVAGAAMEEAREVGREAQSDLDNAARAAKDEADKGTRGEGTAADSAANRVEEAASRVSGAAERKAKEENLGSPRS